MNFSLGHVVAVDGSHGDAHFPDGSFRVEFQRVGIVVALVLVETDEVLWFIWQMQKDLLSI